MFRALFSTVLCALLLCVSAARGAEPSELFAQGEQAFAAQSYREALDLFTAARAAGSAGPSTLYNIGVCQYRLGDYASAEATFAALASEFAALRELAEYNRGLALRAAGHEAAARVAFERARSSSDEKIAALASVQLGQLAPEAVAGSLWSRYWSASLGHDDNVALIDDALLASGRSPSSTLIELVGAVSRSFATAPLRLDASGYVVRYGDAAEFDQSAVRFALVADRRLGAWTLSVGPTLARSSLDGDGFEELIGADLRVRRPLGERLAFDARVVYDDASGADRRFAYLEGSRRQLRFGIQHSGSARVRAGYDLERNERLDPGVSPSRQRWSLSYQRRLSAAWDAEAAWAHRTSRYREANVPREEVLTELALAARRDLRSGWAVNAEYRWSENDSTVDAFSYDGTRVVLGLGRGF